ncbi:MAG: DUF447 family protein [Desulfovibrionaceae bacterium]|jgi:hypothetical protein|nr:DUF447 family protein [Desulfovibrionaceae bacterium]
MNEQIFEAIVTTLSAGGQAHIAPMGICYQDEAIALMPFKPSATLDNIVATGHAVLNIVTDTRVFAGCVTGRGRWPTRACERIEGVRLHCALRHIELKLIECRDDPRRPLLRMAPVHEAEHARFDGFNRAQAAVIEGAVLISRLHLLAPGKIDQEMDYLQIAIDKTAGPNERQAWQWLRQAQASHRAAAAKAPSLQLSPARGEGEKPRPKAFCDSLGGQGRRPAAVPLATAAGPHPNLSPEGEGAQHSAPFSTAAKGRPAP